MMETVTIPSPTAFLTKSPVPSTATLESSSALPLPPVLEKQEDLPPVNKGQTEEEKEHDGEEQDQDREGKGSPTIQKQTEDVTRPKQSKSRNGCITCKAKRLKCDEMKPACQQCHKRTVECGGYKKDFKWRPFEETNVAIKVNLPAARVRRSKSDAGVCSAIPTTTDSISETDVSSDLSQGLKESQTPPDLSKQVMPVDDVPKSEALVEIDRVFPLAVQVPETTTGQIVQPAVSFDMNGPPYLREIARSFIFEPDSVTSSLDSLFEDSNYTPTTARTSILGQSSPFMDFISPRTELMMYSGEQLDDIEPFHFQLETGDDELGDDEEQLVIPRLEDNLWTSLRSPLHSPELLHISAASERPDPYSRMFKQPEVSASSPEMLMLRFDKQTCGILSIKDGPTENPWRTLVWPLARDSPALYHAIASMTAFHTCKERPALRVDGMEHMRKSIRQLASGLEKMRTDTALATTLALALSESWDQHISTGIKHLRGARILVGQALSRHNRSALDGDELARLRFLCNTWIYMDVIARLTSVDTDVSTDFNNVLAPLYGPLGNQSTEVDPLMGCASTLFPLIGSVADLCRKIRRAESNSIAIVSQAMDLKEKVEKWQVGAQFEAPEDPSSDIQHALQTAEAYRFATLLYLHQAVPEIPSLTTAQLAKKVLIFLATVPLSSRLVIVQIYPLLAAGCEARDAEDRAWVEQRWRAMDQRMWIGNVDKCWQVTQEVWRRRDAYENQRRAESSRRAVQVQTVEGAGVKRKFEEDLAMADTFSFSEMLYCSSPSSAKRHGRTVSMSAAENTFGVDGAGIRYSSSSGMPFLPPPRKRTESPTTEKMEPEATVRGSAHWVGVMRDWQWEGESCWLDD